MARPTFRRDTRGMASGSRLNGRTSATSEATSVPRPPRAARLPVASIRVDGEAVPFVDAWLAITDDPPDFELCITTQSAPLGTVVSIEVTLLDGRVLVAQGVDAEPSPWSHRYVNGLGEPRWKRPASGFR